MKRTRVWLKRLLIGAVLVLVAAVATVVALALSTVPSFTGTQVLPGLTQPVSIIRDRNGVPHIIGTTVEDLYRALGFAHAQDRLWQMELMRRVGQGRLAEIFGEQLVDTDIFLRTLDLAGHAERSYERFPADAKALLEAYAAGVNAFLERPVGLFESRWPPEFLVLHHKPEPWRPADSLTLVKVMALNLSANLGPEIQRLTLAAQGFSPDEIEDIMPLNDGEKPPPLPDLSKLFPLRSLGPGRTRAAALDNDIGSGASNNWVVAGSRTVTGKPLLANDPHLRLSAPSIWYLVHLALEGSERANLVGASLPGTPIVVLGRGDTIAWGFTNTEADVQDVFIEKLNPDNPEEYLTPDGWRRFDVDVMEIRVARGETRLVERRRTRHGPVLPPQFRNLGRILGQGYVAALQWTALSDDDTTVLAGLFSPNIRTVSDWIERTRHYVVPMQSMVVADMAGDIALIAPGRLPIRHLENQIAGRAPVPGWEAKYDWQGYVAFEELPRTINPPDGVIGTANARIVSRDYPHHITYDWDADYRHRRVAELLAKRDKHDMATMQAVQLDVFSPAFAELAPLMIAAAKAAVSEEEDLRQLLDQVERWDAQMRSDAVEPLVFMAWLRETVQAVFADDLGPVFRQFFRPQAKALIRVLKGQASGRDWCDDINTPARESCGDILAAAFRRAIADLESRYGKDRAKWSWGQAHYASGEHRVFSTLPLIGRYFIVGTASPGGPYTLNRGLVEFDSEDPFANRHASTLRAIYDLSDLDNSLFMQPTGQSGNPFSRFYRTFETSWSEGQYIRIPTDPAEIRREAIGTWRLLPN